MSARWSMLSAVAVFAACTVCADDQIPSVGPGSARHKALQARCATAKEGAPREQCMRDAEAAAEKAGEHCADLTLRARDQCMADVQSTAQEQAREQAAGGAAAGAATGGVPTPASASPGSELNKQQ